MNNHESGGKAARLVKGLTRREFVLGAAAFGLGAMMPGAVHRALASMAPVPKGAEASVPVLTIRKPEEFKILQVTDCHMNFVAKGFLGEPEKIEAIKGMVEKFDPDVIVNTGDFWANVTTPPAADTCKWLCAEFAKFKKPWAFAWGNHDESTDYDKTHAVLEKAPNSLYRGGAADGNYRIEIRTEGGDAPVWNFIMLNDSRGGFKPEQIDWFNAEVERIKKETPAPPPAFLFFHIPLPQYEDVAFAGKAKGVKFEKVCHEGGSTEALA
ncbi:MAG TPA: metallophosphoesterase, partial [bacterium]|nr:metallophosphoesterase [bacterium]